MSSRPSSARGAQTRAHKQEALVHVLVLNVTEAQFVFQAQGVGALLSHARHKDCLLEGQAGFMSRAGASVFLSFFFVLFPSFLFFGILEAIVEILGWNACSLCHYGKAVLSPLRVRQLLSGSLVLSTFIPLGDLVTWHSGKSKLVY